MKEERKTVRSRWEHFERSAVPAGAPRAQRSATEEAFYAGAASMFMLLQQATESPLNNPTQLELHGELLDFAERKAGRRA